MVLLSYPKYSLLSSLIYCSFDTVDDVLDTDVGDHLLQVKFFLKFLRFFLEGEDFKGG